MRQLKRASTQRNHCAWAELLNGYCTSELKAVATVTFHNDIPKGKRNVMSRCSLVCGNRSLLRYKITFQSCTGSVADRNQKRLLTTSRLRHGAALMLRVADAEEVCRVLWRANSCDMPIYDSKKRVCDVPPSKPENKVWRNAGNECYTRVRSLHFCLSDT